MSVRFTMPDSETETFKPRGFNGERIVLDFNHLPEGKNCQMSALRRLLHHYDFEISEPMLFGVASGLGFIYWHMKKMPAPFCGGMNTGKYPGIIGTAIERVGGKWSLFKSSNVAKAHQHLKDILREGQPALVCADMAYLEHLGTGGDQHFGQHTFLVYGIDEDADIAYISDRFDNPLTMSLTQLQQARASKYRPFPAQNQILKFTIPKRHPNLRKLIPSAIKKNIEYMLNPPIKNMGVSGIKKWSKMFPKYPEFIIDEVALVNALMEHYIYIETGGSGGALFRRMYSEFLGEAAEVTGKSRLLEISKEMDVIADLWTDVANSMLPDNLPNLRSLRDIHWRVNQLLEKDAPKSLSRVWLQLEKVPTLIEIAAEEEIGNFELIANKIQETLVVIHQKETELLTRLKGIVT